MTLNCLFLFINEIRTNFIEFNAGTPNNNQMIKDNHWLNFETSVILNSIYGTTDMCLFNYPIDLFFTFETFLLYKHLKPWCNEFNDPRHKKRNKNIFLTLIYVCFVVFTDICCFQTLGKIFCKGIKLEKLFCWYYYANPIVNIKNKA